MLLGRQWSGVLSILRVNAVFTDVDEGDWGLSC